MKNWKEIKFSEEWEKLKPENRKLGKVFTTIRGYYPNKETYYNTALENDPEFHIMVKGVYTGKAELIGVSVARPSHFGLEFLRADTFPHYNKMDIQKVFEDFYRNKDPVCLFLRLKWTDTGCQSNIDRFQGDKDKYPFKCDDCPSKFATQELLDSHIQDRHPDRKKKKKGEDING